VKRLFAVVCFTLVVPLTILALASGGGAARAVKAATPPKLAQWLLPPDSQSAPVSPARSANALLPAVTLPTPGVGTAVLPAAVPSPPAAVPSPPAMVPSPPALPTAQAAVGQGVPVAAAPTAPNGIQYAPTNAAATAQWPPTGQAAPSKPPDNAGDRLAAWGPAPAPQIDPRRFTEAHWQGLEVIPKTPTLARALKIPANSAGVVLDDATLPADLQGFQAGDLIMRVGAVETPDLLSFIRATEQLRDLKQADVVVLRAGVFRSLVLAALLDRLGTANGETPPMIQPGSAPPHRYEGPCLNCHRIGTGGQLAIDQGDLAFKTAPPIRAGSACPHRDRGTCTSCHQLLQ
jgi:hypothetical protein